MIETSPVVEGLLMIHKIISRGLSISISKCDEYIAKKGIPPGEIKGFSMYVAALKRVTHSHHLSEDEIAFPYYKDSIDAPYNRLKDDHHNISRVLVALDQCLKDLSPGGMDRLHKILNEFHSLWVPHIRIEEDNFTTDKLQAASGMKEQVILVEKLARHGSKYMSPGPLTLPFLFFNLEVRDRKAFMMPFPWMVKKVLVPIIWKGQWKPMSPFLL